MAIRLLSKTILTEAFAVTPVPPTSPSPAGSQPMASGNANHYEIRGRGHLGETMCAAFPDLRASVDEADTALTGPASDQAAVFGVLGIIESLGLELLEVRRIAPG